jgi:hypothetical protein
MIGADIRTADMATTRLVIGDLERISSCRHRPMSGVGR